MELGSVAVLGGGPGGLYVARLLRLRDPDCRVDLYEQNPASNTFGFGVGLATRTQRNLRAADAPTFEAILERSWSHDMSMAVGGRRVVLRGGDLIAIGRATLLDVLREHAEAAGVVVHAGERVDPDTLDADLVIAADGVGSATRERHAEAFGAEVVTHDGLYLWAGTDVALPQAVFCPVETEVGTFTAHAYPYQADRSTFLVETDPDTWRRAGFDRSTAATPPDADDEESLAYLSQAFAAELGGHRLIGNRTRWLQFRTVTCRRWHDGRTVLLGDAVHTAHYSIGSGTKLAMEDGIALAAAIAEADDLEQALDRYEAERRPAVEHLQETAHRSMQWWDTFPERLDLPVERLLVAYMSRAGKVGLERFAGTAPEVVRAAVAQWAGCDPADVPSTDLDAWVLAHGAADTRAETDQVVPVDLPAAHGPRADAVVADLARGERVVLASAPDPSSVLTMLDVAERVRRHGTTVVARVPGDRADLAAAALASGRVDGIDLT